MDSQENDVSALAGMLATAPDESKLDLDVAIREAGPCKRNVEITIGRDDIDNQLEDSLGEFRRDAAIPGFRPGKAPRSLIVRRFRKELDDQVKAGLIMKALQQVEQDHKLNAIAQPNIDFESIVMPETGSLTFSFEVEVEPEVEVPDYSGLSVDRPVFEITDQDVQAHLDRIRSQSASQIDKDRDPVLGDTIVADLIFEHEGKQLSSAEAVSFRLQPELVFRDGRAKDVDEKLKGAVIGETRNLAAEISTSSANSDLRGQSLTLKVTLQGIQSQVLPAIDDQFLARVGVESAEQLDMLIRDSLQSQMQYEQDQIVRRNVLSKLLDQTNIELPDDLVRRQEQSTLRRRIYELRDAGYEESDIRAQEIELRSKVHEETLRSLKEHFLLSQIAEQEEIKVDDADVDAEIVMIANRRNESPRRVRSQIEKAGMRDQIMIQLLERRALEKVMEFVQFEDVAWNRPATRFDAVDYTATGEAEPDAEPDQVSRSS